ncbi:MAG: oligosaccharide flippase family protein, partial [Flavobacteriaceae bacterium]
MEQKESYKEILKATTLFGGVKVFGILISILRSKAIAIFIGAEGMGIASLLLTTVNLVNGLTNLGLDKSGIKEVALVSETKSEKELLRTTGLLMRLIWGTAVLGALAMLLFSPLLSWFAFGNYLYTISFIWLSLAMVFMHLTNGRLAILQGLRKHRALAKANIWGSFIALLLTVPLYYYFGINAIVPAIIISTMITLVITYKYSLGIYFKAVRVNFVKAYREGQPMIKLGLVLSFSGIMSLLAGYLLQVYISSINGTEAVGFYNAGYIILNSYLGLIFNAMATDYFPRL